MAHRNTANKKHRGSKRTGKNGKSRLASADLKPVEGFILSVFQSHPTTTFTTADLQTFPELENENRRSIKRAISSLIRKSHVRRFQGKWFQLVDLDTRAIFGKISIAPEGFGFIQDQCTGCEYFVAPGHLRGSSHGDSVLAEVKKASEYGRTAARVIQVVKKESSPVTGRFVDLGRKGGLVYPDDNRLPAPVRIAQAATLNAREGDQVLVSLSHSGKNGKNPKGFIEHVFGPSGDNKARFKALLTQLKFNSEFTREALEEAEALDTSQIDLEAEKRIDLRNDLIFTIDPDQAKDFDDAISLKKRRYGYELGVHIADVSWYVRPGSALDAEALERNTTVYSSHGTSPMLPERLSSDICSLREGVDRRTVSVFMQISTTGQVLDSSIRRSVINSRHRFTYGQVQDRIDGLKGKWNGSLPVWRKNELNAVIYHLYKLTLRLRQLRYDAGGINLDVPDYEAELDEYGEVFSIQPREDMEAHHLVEECMLLANRSVTEFFNKCEDAESKNFVYRVHDRPNPERLNELGAFLETMGVEWPFYDSSTITSKRLNDWLIAMSNHPASRIIRLASLRAMAKAEYSTGNIGHFGLGFSHYTHFTSPIRRYPDIAVHRLLMDRLEQNEDFSSVAVANLRQICSKTSERERAAQEIERKSLAIRRAEYYSDRLGENVKGIVFRANSRGLIVLLEDTGTRGVIRSSDLGWTYYDQDQRIYYDQDDMPCYQPGSEIEVQIIGCDPGTGAIEMILADVPERLPIASGF